MEGVKMNRIAIGLGVLVILAGVAHALISLSLQEQLGKAQPDERLPIQIVLNQQFDNELLRSLVEGMPPNSGDRFNVKPCVS